MVMQSGVFCAQEATPALMAQGAAAGVVLQLALAAPFLAVAPGHYVSRAFELSRCTCRPGALYAICIPSKLHANILHVQQPQVSKRDSISMRLNRIQHNCESSNEKPQHLGLFTLESCATFNHAGALRLARLRAV